MDKDLIISDLQAKDSFDAIEQLGKKMLEKGFVKSSYVKAVTDREKEYPTGLPTVSVKVAIPHTDTTHVNQSAIGVGILKDPVEFMMMGGSGERVPAEIIFLLAIEDQKLQLETLKKLMNLFQNDDLLKEIKAEKETGKLAKRLNEMIN
ncbi:MAG TPA: PTS fructose transporter subunit IIA [Eubacteriaceae bacterium]|nr:PTS fructose transporter subunit IIA [Eubacteriaceae bacterium]